MLSPNNLVDMVEYIKVQTQLELESNEKKEDISLIANNIVVLGELYLFISYHFHYFHKTTFIII